MRRALVTLNATGDPREEAGGLAGVRVLRAEIDVIVPRASAERVRADLESVKNSSHGTKCSVHTPRSKHEGKEMKGGFES